MRGNPDHPFTRGGFVSGQRRREPVYSDASLSPDAHDKGPQFVAPPGTALARSGRDGHDCQYGQRPSCCYLGTQGILNGLNAGDTFFNRLGATISERTFCDSGAITAFFMSCGPTAAVDPESFVHSKYIILWAINTISTNLHHWPFIAEAQARGAKVVVVDPVSTRTAKRADWHLRIRPGTDAALALGMINVIIAEDLVDHDYVGKYTVGYDELKERAAEFPPEKVADLTGIPADDVRKLAASSRRRSPR